MSNSIQKCNKINMNIRVPFIDLKQRYIDEKDELLTIIEKTIEKGSLV